MGHHRTEFLRGKRGQTPLAFVILLLMFVVIWFVWLGKFLGEVGQSAIETGNLTGVEAFAYANLNIFVLIAVILGAMGYFYYSGSQ